MNPAPWHGRDGARAIWLRADDGIRLRAAIWGDSGDVIALFPGRTEYLEKYDRFARRLVRKGYRVLGIDWRGQGLSDRLIADPLPGHIGHFDDYQRDVDALWSAGWQPDYILAHSMGGAIAAQAMARKNPRAAVLCAPMFGINLYPVLAPLALPMAKAAVAVGLSQVPLPASTRIYTLDHGFTDNTLTSSAQEWGRLMAEAAAWPQMALGNPTFGWAHAALEAIKTLRQTALPDCPTRIALGLDEAIVDPEAIRSTVARWPQAQLRTYPAARHELMMEIPAIQQALTQDIVTHFRSYA